MIFSLQSAARGAMYHREHRDTRSHDSANAITAGYLFPTISFSIFRIDSQNVPIFAI